MFHNGTYKWLNICKEDWINYSSVITANNTIFNAK